MVKFQEKMVTGKIAFEGEAWRSEWMDDVLCKGQAFQAERTASIKDGKQPGREPGRAGAEPETLWEEGWEMRPVMGGDGSVRPGPSRPRKDFSFFRARKSLAALSQKEPWSQAALLRMQEWGDQVGNQCNKPHER